MLVNLLEDIYQEQYTYKINANEFLKPEIYNENQLEEFIVELQEL